jgi:glycosyltransferase involved in cell wall biosynthesis
MDRCSDAVIAVCEAARQQAIAEGTPAEKIETIYNSVEAQPAPDRSTRLFAGSPVIGTVGRMDSYKGQAYLIGALPVVLIEFPDARFVLIGDGPERECLQSSAERLGVGDRVSFLGTRSDVSVLMSQLDLFVLPSLLEGFPNAVLEAMAARLPIVATRVGGVPELIEDGRTGLLVEPGSAQALAEAIIRIWTDHDLRRGCATAAHEAVRTKYCPQREAEDTEAVYLRLLAERCGHARQGVAVR